MAFCLGLRIGVLCVFTTAAELLLQGSYAFCLAEPALAAFPGAVGQGAATVGGRGGDVYHVTNLDDYVAHEETKIPGSLRHAIRSAEGARTIVFEVSGPIALRAPLEIHKSQLTIAGQTSPGGVTLWGYPLEISGASDVIVRFLRVRTGDFHARRPTTNGASAGPDDAKGNNDLDAGSANACAISNCDRVILDHVSASWGMDETLSVTKSRNVTVQHSIIAQSLDNSLHPKGQHGYGSLVRGELAPGDQQEGVGGYTFFGNLWAHHRARNPSIGGQQSLDRNQAESERRRTDVNLVNNVIYNWGDQATHRSEKGDVRINLVGNYYINGPAKASQHFFKGTTHGSTAIYQYGNCHDGDQDASHDGVTINTDAEIERAFDDLGADDDLKSDGEAFNFLASVQDQVISAEHAYDRVVRTGGASLWRDSVDRKVVDSLIARDDGHIDSQEELRDAQGNLPGIDDLTVAKRAADFDTDKDGMPDEFERTRNLNPDDPKDRNHTNLSGDGYTNLEVYLNSLVESLD